MTTMLTGPEAWQHDDVDPALVTRLHHSVGEALTAAHVAHEEAGRGRLTPADERALARKLVADEMRSLAARAYAEGQAPLDEPAEAKVTAAVLDRIHGLARLQPLLDDPEIRDIHISGAQRVWLNLRDGSKVRGPSVAETDDDLVELIATAARRIGRSERRWDHAHPELNLQLPNGDRLHALMAVSGRPTVTIRRHDFDIHRVSQLIDLGVCDGLVASFLSAAVRARANIIVAGGTGTGKTTTLRCLINEIPADERLITVEDSLEIGLERFEDLHPDHETLEAREVNTEGVGSFTLAELVRSALRMDPQRVIVGEVRGAEVLPMLLAMSQGNDGSMCSIHADSSKGVFGRLAMYAAMTPERLVPEVTNLLVANAVDLIVHLGWVTGERRVTSVRQLTGTVEGGQVVSNELWRPDASGGGVPAAPPTPEFASQLEAHGFDATAHAAALGWWR
ncbi:ATPase, T2SS/T4P/T4SS family [Iamia majanohamensis]|uniref:ATPase, T2SS/T4P/T4SS family n=1 Tax=Iamia majanohamensis TaxID=467976 RepID=A0AAE9YHM1_9ACTN|nr:ATPase, T2SS/T4P/T4SS family [Iamia majanohamensis]WCO67946.1 ATPase, T2SS/T4P/T4SS family [Iamia majanohamensis]